MEYAISKTPDTVVVALKGRFTFADAARFKQALDHLKEAQGSSLIIDLAALEFIDSAAMGMLLMTRDTAAAEKIPLTLRGPTGQVKRILDVAKFNVLFEIAD